MSTPRYAVYFAPAVGSPWWTFGAGWLGRDEARDLALPQPVPPGLTAADFAQLTSQPRRYGFHATLKAPFRLRREVDEALLLRRLAALATGLRCVRLPPLVAAPLDDFVALLPRERDPAVDALAAHCVLELDDLRARVGNEEMAQRQPDRLDDVGRDLLARFGYPHVLGRFRFHLTLSGPVDALTADRLVAAARDQVERLNAGTPLQLDRLCLFREPAPGAPFARLHDAVLAP